MKEKVFSVKSEQKRLGAWEFGKGFTNLFKITLNIELFCGEALRKIEISLLGLLIFRICKKAV